MEVAEAPLKGVQVLAPVRHEDSRGFLSEVFNVSVLHDLGIAELFVQENHVYSQHEWTVRGLHYQTKPGASKLVRVVHGAIYDVGVDLRKASPTYGEHYGTVLSAENWKQLYLPVGFAHGFCTLEPHTEVCYYSSQHWSSAVDRGILWDDPDLAIDWPIDFDRAVVSTKDRRQPRFSKIESPF